MAPSGPLRRHSRLCRSSRGSRRLPKSAAARLCSCRCCRRTRRTALLSWETSTIASRSKDGSHAASSLKAALPCVGSQVDRRRSGAKRERRSSGAHNTNEPELAKRPPRAGGAPLPHWNTKTHRLHQKETNARTWINGRVRSERAQDEDCRNTGDCARCQRAVARQARASAPFAPDPMLPLLCAAPTNPDERARTIAAEPALLATNCA